MTGKHNRACFFNMRSSSMTDPTENSADKMTDVLSTASIINGHSDAYKWDSSADDLFKVIDKKSLEDLKIVLKTGTSVNSRGDTFRETALHRATQAKWVEGVKCLLEEGAAAYIKNAFGQTPLHYAAAADSSKCLSLLLNSEKLVTLELKDERGYTPLHDSAAAGHIESARLLIKAGASVNAVDRNNETPLHKAVKCQSIPTVLQLLRAGADFNHCDSSGESVLSYMFRYMPEGFNELFDNSLRTNTKKISSKSLEVNMDFISIAGTDNMKQTQLLKKFVALDYPKLLLHPLCETFLYLKWLKVRKIFLVEVVFYFIYAILVTLLTLDKYVWCHCSQSSNHNSSNYRTFNNCRIDISKTYIASIPGLYWALFALIVVQCSMTFMQQCLIMWQSGFASLKSIWHVLHIIIVILVYLVLIMAGSVWQNHLAAILLLLLWTQCMLIISRFPACGIYVSMFVRVAQVFVKIFSVYFCLLVGFSLAFYVAHYSDVVFGNPFLAFIKTLTMMIGEVDFGNDYVELMRELPITAHIIFLSFTILIAIILSNLLVALAVNDVQALRNSAHLERLITQLELVNQMEKHFAIAGFFATFFKSEKLSEIAKILILDCKETRVSLLPCDPKNSHLIRIKNKYQNQMYEERVPKDLPLRILEILRLMDFDTLRDKKSSVRRQKTRSRYRRELSDESRGIDHTDMIANIERRMEDLVMQYERLIQHVADIESELCLVVATSPRRQSSRTSSSKSVADTDISGFHSDNEV